MIMQEKDIRDRLNNSNEATTATYVAMIKYYTTYDYMNGTRHVEILRSIYEGKQNLTIDGIALNRHIGRRTFDRYRKEYLKCFEYYENSALLKNEAAISSVSE